MARFIVDIPTEDFKNTGAKELSRELSNYLLDFNKGLNTVQCVEEENDLQFYDPTDERIENYEGVYMHITVADPQEKIEVGDMFMSLDNVNPNESLVLNNGVGVWNDQDDEDLGQTDYVKVLPYDKQ